MPLFHVEIEKLYQAEYWVNRYFVDAATLQAASTIGEQIYNAERTVHLDVITFTKLSCRTVVEGDFSYQTIPLNQPGLSGAGANHLMPLFNVVRCDLTVANSKPSRKYLRGILHEGIVTFNTIFSGSVDYINTNYVSVLGNIVGLVDPQGADIYGGSVHPFVGMRQLRRGSKKKVTPSSPTPA